MLNDRRTSRTLWGPEPRRERRARGGRAGGRRPGDRGREIEGRRRSAGHPRIRPPLRTAGRLHCSAHHSRCARAPGSRSRSSTPRPSRPVCGRSRLVRSRRSRAAVCDSTSWNGQGSRRSPTCWPPRSDQLHAVPGVGPQTVYQVVEAARLAAVQVHHDTRFRFDPDHPDPGQTRLLATLAAIRAADGTAATLRGPLQDFTARTAPLAEEAERAGSRLKMFFAGRATKNAALNALARLDALLAEPAAQALQQTVAQRESAVDPRSYPPDQLWHGYRTDAASVNAVLSTVGPSAGRRGRGGPRVHPRGAAPADHCRPAGHQPADGDPARLPGVRRAVRDPPGAVDPRRRDGARQDGAGARRAGPPGREGPAPVPGGLPGQRADQLAQRDRQAQPPDCAQPPRRGPRSRGSAMAARGRRRRHHVRHARPAAGGRAARRASRCSSSTRRTS